MEGFWKVLSKIVTFVGAAAILLILIFGILIGGLIF